jgi:hypothetical protein
MTVGCRRMQGAELLALNEICDARSHACFRASRDLAQWSTSVERVSYIRTAKGASKCRMLDNTGDELH